MIYGFELGTGNGANCDYPVFVKNGKTGLAKVSLNYGPNGSGKTTLARMLGGDQLVESGAITFLGEDKKPINGIKSHLYNEDFILGKIRVEEDEVGAIVLLGDAAENREKISSLEDENQILLSEIDKLEAEQKVLERTGKGSVQKAREEVRKQLNEAGWGENLRKIKGQAQPLKLTEPALLKIVSSLNRYKETSGVKTEIGELKENLKRQIENICRATADDSAVVARQELSRIDELFDEANLQELLNEVPKGVSGDDLVTAIAEALKDPKVVDITRETREIIVNEDSHQCPLCFQLIEGEHRRRLGEALNKVYNGDREDLEDRLVSFRNAMCFPANLLDEGTRAILPQEKVDSFDVALDAVRAKFEEIKNLVEQKIVGLESKILLEAKPFKESLKELNTSIDSVNESIQAHNKTVDGLDNARAEADKLNDLVCGFDSRAEIQTYEDRKNRLETIGQILTTKNKDLDTNMGCIKQLESENQNTALAVELVNGFLKVIFFEENRLTIYPLGNGYGVCSRGSRLKPQDLSTGERNILSLAYFFADIFESIEDYKNPENHRLVILDDPLSSFDEDNRYGVLVFLKQMVDRISSVGGGQVIFFTHDARLMYNLSDTFKTSGKIGVSVNKLMDKKLGSLSLENSNKYKSILERVVSYSLLGTKHSSVLKNRRGEPIATPEELIGADLENYSSSKIPSGNDVRQVLEAFGEFNFGKNVSNLLQDSNVTQALENEGKDFSVYLKGSLSKLFLHGESHTADAIKSGNVDLTPLVSDEGRLQLCREIMCLISVLTPSHLASRLNLPRKIDDDSITLTANELDNYIHEWSAELEKRVLPVLR